MSPAIFGNVWRRIDPRPKLKRRSKIQTRMPVTTDARITATTNPSSPSRNWLRATAIAAPTSEAVEHESERPPNAGERTFQEPTCNPIVQHLRDAEAGQPCQRRSHSAIPADDAPQQRHNQARLYQLEDNHPLRMAQSAKKRDTDLAEQADESCETQHLNQRPCSTPSISENVLYEPGSQTNQQHVDGDQKRHRPDENCLERLLDERPVALNPGEQWKCHFT